VIQATSDVKLFIWHTGILNFLSVAKWLAQSLKRSIRKFQVLENASEVTSTNRRRLVKSREKVRSSKVVAEK